MMALTSITFKLHRVVRVEARVGTIHWCCPRVLWCLLIKSFNIRVIW